MRSDLRLLLVLALAASGAGCAKPPDDVLVDEAARIFARQTSCPADRLQVKHAEMRLADLVETEEPPAEVAADAGRLSVWKQTRDRELASFQHLTAVDVAGCSSHATYFCWYGHRIHRDHECAPVDLDPSEPHFLYLALKPSAEASVRNRLGLPPAVHAPAPADAAGTIRDSIAAEVRARESEMQQRLDAMAKEIAATAPTPKPARSPHR